MTLAVPLLAAVIALRLAELYVSRRRVQSDARASIIPEPGYAAMVAVHAGWIAGCALEPLLTHARRPFWLVAAALVVWALALALRAWLWTALGSLWNVRLVQRQEQPIVATGPYRYLRHPNYLAVILEIGALPLALGAYGTAFVFSVANALVLWRRIVREEAYLLSVPGYQDAFGTKKRLIPGVF